MIDYGYKRYAGFDTLSVGPADTFSVSDIIYADNAIPAKTARRKIRAAAEFTEAVHHAATAADYAEIHVDRLMIAEDAARSDAIAECCRWLKTREELAGVADQLYEALSKRDTRA